MVCAEKRYLLGRAEDGRGGTLFLGRYLALDGSPGAPVFLDVLKPHAMVICGKRGYGKSYTMGVLLEELARLPEGLRQNFSVVVIDTMGIFGQGVSPSSDERLMQWGLSPGGLDLNVFAPEAFLERMPPGTLPFHIPVEALSFHDYCELLGVDPLSQHGAALACALGRPGHASIESLSREVAGSGAPPEVRFSLCGLLDMIAGWKLFGGRDAFGRLLAPGTINVVDLSGYGHDPGIKACVVSSLARALYDARVRARRAEDGRREVPLVWMMIDEAHMFAGGRAGQVLTDEWLRQGRQPGLSLVLATQRPSALGPDVISQADLIICHRLTLRDDIEAMEHARPVYAREPMREALSRLGRRKGAAIVLDDATESCHVITVRPRTSAHGGGEPEIYGMD